MSAPVCWQDKQRQPDLRASLLWLCLEAKPKINNTAALRLWIPTPPTTGPAIPPPTNPGKGRRGRVKINILSSHVSQHNICRSLLSKCVGQGGMNQVPGGVSGLFLEVFTWQQHGEVTSETVKTEEDTRRQETSWTRSCYIKSRVPTAAVIMTENRPGLKLVFHFQSVYVFFTLIDSLPNRHVSSFCLNNRPKVAEMIKYLMCESSQWRKYKINKFTDYLTEKLIVNMFCH